jgi:branched-chain amino acid aminotransferase
VTPVRSIDKITIGAGAAGPVTRKLQARLLDIAHGRAADEHDWLTPVATSKEAAVA